MVQQGDANRPSRFTQLPRNVLISFTGQNVTMRMIVRNKYGMCAPTNRLSEHLAWMNQRSIGNPFHEPNRFGQWMTPGINRQHIEHFLFDSGLYMLAKEPVCRLCRRDRQFAHILLLGVVPAAHKFERRRQHALARLVLIFLTGKLAHASFRISWMICISVLFFS